LCRIYFSVGTERSTEFGWLFKQKNIYKFEFLNYKEAIPVIGRVGP
jgi:hypothetical protein